MYRHRSMLLALVALTVCSLIISSCEPEKMVSRSQEEEIGREAAKEIESEYKLVKDPKLNALVTQMGNHLVQYSGREDIEYKFKILDIQDVNAVSLPGGWIYVYKGLIDVSLPDNDRLAGVIAHEIAHVAARHHAEQIGKQVQASILIGTLTKGDVTTIASLLANLQFLSWSRENEFEADRLGVKYLYQSQYKPEGLVNFLQYLVTMRKGKVPSKFEQIFHTHPVSEDRVKRANQYLDDLRSGKQKP